MDWASVGIGSKVILQRRISGYAGNKTLEERYIETPIIGETRNSWVLRDGTNQAIAEFYDHIDFS